jgi:hypothetical protein
MQTLTEYYLMLMSKLCAERCSMQLDRGNRNDIQMALSHIMVDKLQFIGEMRGETRVGNFSRKASPHPSKAFKKGLFFTNLVQLNDELNHFLL